MKNKAVMKSAITTIILFISTFLIPLYVHAEPFDATVTVISPETVDIGNNFNITINISYVEDFDAANFDVTFNSDIINVTQVTGGKINNTNLPCSWSFIENGRIRLIINLPGLTGISGEGNLAEIQFETITAGTSNINLSNGVLSNSTVQPITAEWINGTVQVQNEEEFFYLTTEVLGEGSIIVDPEGPYSSAQIVHVEAIPADNFEFKNWTGDLTGTEKSTNITMNGNKTITANFILIQEYNLTISKIGNGTVNPEIGTHKYNQGTDVQLEAIPDPGWIFSHWEGNISGTNNKTTITINGNKTVTAIFEEYTAEPKISIGLSSINLFKTKIYFENTGEVDITNMNWSMQMDSVLTSKINFSDNGSIVTLNIGEEKTISSEKIGKGIGFVKIKIKATVDEQKFDKKFNGLKFGPILLILA